MSFPCPLFPDLNSRHTHFRVNVTGACPSEAAMQLFLKSSVICHYSPCRACAFKSHRYSFRPCLCHFFLCLATASTFVPLPAILSLLFPHSAPISRVLVSSSHVSPQEKTEGEDWKGPSLAVEFAGESLGSVVCEMDVGVSPQRREKGRDPSTRPCTRRQQP